MTRQTKWIVAFGAGAAVVWLLARSRGAQANVARLTREVVTPLLTRFPRLRASSFLRSALENWRAGGTAQSKHLTGEAVDLAPYDAQAAKWAAANLPAGYQIIHEPRKNHVHIEWDPPQAAVKRELWLT